MAEAVVSMVIEGLKGSLVEEVKFLSGVSDQIEHAQTELLLMQGFLKDADAKQVDNEVVRIWVQIIREAAYDLEDVIESFALKVVLKRGGSVELVLKRFACIFNEVVNRHKVGSEIRSITAKLFDMRSKLQGYNIQQITGTQYGGATSSERQKEQRQTYPHVIQRDVVGLEKDIEELVSQLVNEEKGPQVVSIWGMGGSGKTTLAKQVYDHKEAVKRHFDSFAWVCVSQQCQGKEVLEDILIKLTHTTKKEEIEEISKMKKDQIAERLCLIQKEKKCFVVLDDIWTLNAWDSLKPGFPIGEETKSRILLTTRKKDVAEIARENGFVHESHLLDDKESWQLFNDHLRSLLFFVDPEYRFSNWKKKFLRSVVCNFKLLRVLKFEGIRREVELPSNIGNLVHLRFLSVKGSGVRRLPSSLGNLVCLQTLDLRAYGLEVANVIWKMKELRHLYLPMGYRGKLKLATLGNLQSLVNVAGGDCDLTHLAELTNLRKLLIKGGVKNMEEMLKSNGITFNHLRSLSLLLEDDEDIPMNMVLSCPHIYKLELAGSIRDESLEGLQNYQNLTKMSLKYTGLQLESHNILEKIPNLRMLCLGSDSIDKNATEVVVSEEGYPNLEVLTLTGLDELKSWSIEKGGMPRLCRLSIQYCRELRAVPEGLENVTTLKELTINRMPGEFCTRVGEGGEDFYKIQHVPSLLITYILEDEDVDN